MKRCTRCGAIKPLSDFTKAKRYADGLDIWCRECKSASSRNWKANNKERADENIRRWREANREHLQEYERNRRADPEQARAMDRQKYYADVERSRGKHRKWKASHKDQVSEANRRFYAENAESQRERTSLWRKLNPFKKILQEHRRRANKRGNGGSYTQEEWEALCAHYDHRCLRCGQQKPLTADHVIPISKGGTNSIDNLQPLCLSCNSSKKDKIIDYRY